MIERQGSSGSLLNSENPILMSFLRSQTAALDHHLREGSDSDSGQEEDEEEEEWN
jgi:hypothetical protein